MLKNGIEKKKNVERNGVRCVKDWTLLQKGCGMIKKRIQRGVLRENKAASEHRLNRVE